MTRWNNEIVLLKVSKAVSVGVLRSYVNELDDFGGEGA